MNILGQFITNVTLLLWRMMDKDPQNRPTASEILQDSFIKSHMEVTTILLYINASTLSLPILRDSTKD